MVKNAYSIPGIQDTLDSLQGAVWCTLLDLKSGYWWVELEEASKALTAFMVGSLLWEWEDAIWIDEHSSDISVPYWDFFG